LRRETTTSRWRIRQRQEEEERRGAEKLAVAAEISEKWYMLGLSGSVSLRLEREARLEMEEVFDHSNKSLVLVLVLLFSNT